METAGKRVKAAPSDLDRFVSEQNVARYRKLLDASTDDNERRIVIQQLADQMAKLRDTVGNGYPSDIENTIPAGRLRRA
ncbi:MAG TPA: hypothetical protein VMT22_23270 [Terriglobales bacterium]|nr:hypothetical protein [Terriglobales bacterium]